MSLFALIGGVIAFVVVGAIVDLLWVALGAIVGGGIGYGIRSFGHQARTYAETVDLTESASRDALYDEAKQLDIPGRSAMTREELAAAIVERRSA